MEEQDAEAPGAGTGGGRAADGRGPRSQTDAGRAGRDTDGRGPRSQTDAGRAGRDTDGGPTRWRVARIVYLTALGAVLAWVAWSRRGDLAALAAGAEPGWLGAAALLALGQLLPSVAFWTLALRSFGQRPPFRGVLTATARSVPTRYLPGSVWYPLGRAALLRREHGTAPPALGAAAVLEAALAVVVAIALGTGLLALAGSFPARAVWLAAWFALLAAAGSPPAVNAALRFVARRRGGHPARLTWRAWAVLTAVTVVHWGWSAATFTVYLRAFPGLETGPLAEVAGSFLVAWVAGYLAVFAPQGVGVFEATVAAMLVDSGVATVAVVAAGYRALMVVRDAAAFAIAAAGARRRVRGG